MNNHYFLAYKCLLAFSICCLGIGSLHAQKKEKANPFSHVQRTPTGEIRCLTMEMDSLARRENPKMGTLEEFEEWLAPKVEQYKKNLKAGRTEATLITIPVVVHVIHNGDAVGTGENISDAQVQSQITVLNQDFRKMMGTPGHNTNPVGADVEIEFCLAQTAPDGSATNGINRVNTGVASYDTRAAIETMKTTTIWDPTQYMNMWSMRFGGDNAGLLGYAQLS